MSRKEIKFFTDGEIVDVGRKSYYRAGDLQAVTCMRSDIDLLEFMESTQDASTRS